MQIEKELKNQNNEELFEIPTLETHPLTTFIDKLSGLDFKYLYKSPTTCLGIYRWLPPLAQYIIGTLIFSSTEMEWNILKSRISNSESKSYKITLWKLKKWHILQGKGNSVWLNKLFKEKYLIAIAKNIDKNPDLFFKLEGIPLKSELISNNTNPPDKNLGISRWENILKYMVNPTNSQINHNLQKLLIKTELLDQNSKKPTKKGFRFILHDTNVQLWTLLISYINQFPNLKVELLHLLFLTSFLDENKQYKFDLLPKNLISCINDWRAFGLVLLRKSESLFFITKLTSKLLSKRWLNPSLDDQSYRFIIVESNFRIYAYTNSEIHIAILSQFCILNTRFKNLVCGTITKDSVHKAINNGISAEQIIQFIMDNLHEKIQKNNSGILNIKEQIKIWESETKRIFTREAVLYLQFIDKNEYEKLLNFAVKNDVIILNVPSKRMFVVTFCGHELIKSFIKSNSIHE